MFTRSLWRREMCEDAGAVPTEKSLIEKGKYYFRLANRWAEFGFVSGLVFVIVGVVSISGTDHLLCSLLVTLMGLWFIVVTLTVGVGNDGQRKSLEEIWEKFSSANDAFKDAADQLEKERQFIGNFGPPVSLVDEELKRVAVYLKKVFEKQENAYRTGLGYHPADDTKDPESETIQLQKTFNGQLKDIELRVDEAKKRFWKLHKLAKGHGYVVHDSWKPYAGLTKEPDGNKDQDGKSGGNAVVKI